MADTVLAAQLYTIRGTMKTPADMAKSLKKVKKIGYDAVQLSGHGEISTEELKKMTDDAGLIICATHVGFDFLLNETEKAIEMHQILDCKNPAIGGLPGEYRDSGESFRKFAGLADKVGAKLTAAGMNFGYHNHSFEFRKFDGEIALDIIYNNTKPENVKAEIDTYWVQHGGGDPAAWIKKLSGRTPYIHLKDMCVTADGPTFAEIGEGNLNWEAIIPAAKASGVEWYIVEQDTCAGDPFDSLKISLENLKGMGLS